MIRIPSDNCCHPGCSLNKMTDNSIDVKGIMPEKAATVSAPHRLMPAYQKINASAVTNKPYQRSVSHSLKPMPASDGNGCSNRAGIRHINRAIADTIVVWTTGLTGSFWLVSVFKAEMREKILNSDSHAAAQITSIFPQKCSIEKAFAGVRSPWIIKMPVTVLKMPVSFFQQAGSKNNRAKNILAAVIVNVPSLPETNRAEMTLAPASVKAQNK